MSLNFAKFNNRKEGKAEGTIELTKGGRQFLVEHGKLIVYVAVPAWVRFSEAFTPAPRLHDKIGGASVKRGAVSRMRDLLKSMQSGKCFCDETQEMMSPEVDHVLP